MKTKYYAYFALLALVFCCEVTALDVTTCNKNFFVVTGEVEKGDLEKIKSVCIHAKTKMMKIYSHGGDVQEAMKIGRWVRNNMMSVLVGAGTCCQPPPKSLSQYINAFFQI